MKKETRATANQIAEHLIKKMNALDEGDVSNMKLQKLLWFAQKTCFDLSGRPLFEDDFQAWQYGPVVPSVYSTYAVFGRNHISDNYLNEIEDISDFDDHVLNLTIETYKIYSAIGLMKLSHKDHLYKEAYEKGCKHPIHFKDIVSESNKRRKDMLEDICQAVQDEGINLSEHA